jgi:hypothetical protein
VEVGPPGSEVILVDSICDELMPPTGKGTCTGKGPFAEYVAPMFQKGGDVYSLNQFKYEYDFSQNASASELVLEPHFRVKDVSVRLGFEYGSNLYRVGDEGETSATQREITCSISSPTLVDKPGLRIWGTYQHDRTRLSRNVGDSIVYSQSLLLEGRLRFDGLLKSISTPCVFVPKGVDLGFGFAWYQSDDTEVWGTSDYEQRTPFFNGRATVTMYYGFQISYSGYVFKPTSLGKEWMDYHSARLRLLLSNVLPPESGKSYHPDIEFAYDVGQRLPLFEKERRVSVGFTFTTFPWEGQETGATSP